MKRLDLEMRRTDELLYQMIPKQVADRLRKGEAAVETCQLFDSVTILFSDVVTFTEICSRITPMEVVSMLNSMYSLFDQLTEKHHVYKVETIGDAYMVVAGAPDADAKHAYRICLMALDMVTVITDLKDPSTGDSLRIRVGVHTGAVVAGVVGLKMPRYCLFGDAVNTASRMESTSEALKIHISEKTRDMLDLSEWDISDRGTVTVKGKGDMKTYWLHGRTKPPHTPFPMTPIVIEPTTASRKPMTPAELMDSADTRSLYSPVTFEDVSRYTPIPSPVGSAFSEGIPEMDTLKLQEPSVSSRIATQRKGSSRVRSNAVPMDLVQAESRNAEVPMDRLQAESRIAEVPMDRLQAESRNAKVPMDLVQAESKPIETVNSTAVQTSPDPPVCSFGFFAAPTAKSFNFTNAMEPPSIRHEVSDQTNGFLAVKHIHSCYHQWNTPQLTPAYTTSETSRMQQQPVHDFSRKSIKKGNVRLIQVAPKVKDMPDRNDIQRGRPLTKSNTCALL